MKKLYPSIVLICLAANAIAQSDTTYFNQKWKTTSKTEAIYFRVPPIKEGSLYKIQDYYVSGILQMSGYSTTADGETKQGLFVFYNVLGKKTSEGNYENGKKTGIWKSYYMPSEKLSIEHEFKNGKPSGLFTAYDTCGKIITKGHFEDDQRTGKWEYYKSCNGIKAYEQNYSNGLLNGHAASYDAAGKLQHEGEYADNKKTGTWNYYDSTGQLIVAVKYKDGEEKNRKPRRAEIPDEKMIAKMAEQMPKPSVDIARYLGANIHYPQEAKKHNIEGRVVIKFIVDEQGNVTDAEVITGIGGGCDEEALRVVNSMPLWEPGKLKNEPVKVYYTLPIVFKLRDK